jgi:hypothetical protein
MTDHWVVFVAGCCIAKPIVYDSMSRDDAFEFIKKLDGEPNLKCFMWDSDYTKKYVAECFEVSKNNNVFYEIFKWKCECEYSDYGVYVCIVKKDNHTIIDIVNNTCEVVLPSTCFF